MSHNKIEEPSFFLELESAIKSMSVFEGKEKTENLKALFDELKRLDEDRNRSRLEVDRKSSR